MIGGIARCMPRRSGARGWRGAGRGRNRKGEGGAVAQGAFGPDSPAVRFDDALDDRESEPGAVLDAVMGPPETVEHARQIFLAHSGARVGDPKAHVAVLRSSAYVDPPVRFRELDGVTDQVFKNLHEAILIGHDPG